MAHQIAKDRSECYGPLLPIYTKLDKLRLLERLVGTVFGDGAQPFSRHVNRDVLVELRHVDALFLEVWLALGFATRVKLRRTRAVRVAATDLGLFARNIALLSHRRSIKWQHSSTVLLECNSLVIAAYYGTLE